VACDNKETYQESYFLKREKNIYFHLKISTEKENLSK